MSETAKEKSFLAQLVKGTLLGVIVALVSVLIFAGIIKIATLNYTVIKSVNQFIKVIAVFIGCFFSIQNGKGLIKGAMIGLFVAVITLLIFALLGCGVALNVKLLIDLLFLTIVGGISGIISLNVKR